MNGKIQRLSFPFSSANPPVCGQVKRVGSPQRLAEARILLLSHRKDSGQAGMTSLIPRSSASGLFILKKFACKTVPSQIGKHSKILHELALRVFALVIGCVVIRSIFACSRDGGTPGSRNPL